MIRKSCIVLSDAQNEDLILKAILMNYIGNPESHITVLCELSHSTKTVETDSDGRI